MHSARPLALVALCLASSPAFAQDDPLQGRWLVRGEDDRGTYEGSLRFERIDTGRYRAHARLSSPDGSVDRSYDAPATLTTGTLTILRPTTSSIGFTGALDNPVLAKGVVTADKLRIRGGPNTSHQILGMLSRGDPVEILGRDGDFYRIKRGADTPYVSALYVKLDPDPPSAWIGTFHGDGAGYKGTWVKDLRVLGNETLARIKEGELNFAAVDLNSDLDSRDFVGRMRVGSSRVDLQACKLEYSIVSPK